jgi:hypothetical protein
MILTLRRSHFTVRTTANRIDELRTPSPLSNRFYFPSIAKIMINIFLAQKESLPRKKYSITPKEVFTDCFLFGKSGVAK